MRGMDIFCASQAATSIRLSMDDGSSSSSSSAINVGSSRAIDRHNPIIRDAKRIGKSFPLRPCTSDQTPPLSPIPYKHLIHHKDRKSSSSKSNDLIIKKICSSSSKKSTNKQSSSSIDAKLSDEGDATRKKNCAKPGGGGGGDFISAPDSSRYLLGGADTASLDVISDFDPVSALVSVDPTKSQSVKQDDESSASNSKPSSSSSSSSSSRSPDQVVVLRVSLHCKGCEGKVRKHISRMQGVKSFEIEFAAKKVTVVGDVTPLGVLASISKVKNAQLWTPAMPPAVANSCSRSETNHSQGLVISK